MKKSNTDAMKKPTVKGLANLGNLLGNPPEPEDNLPVDPNGPIRAAEGLDMCIWKFCMDRKPRTLGEISEELSVIGFAEREIRDRVVKLFTHKHWFDKTGTGANIRYSLKKSTRMPGSSKETEPTGIALAPSHDPETASLSDEIKKFQMEAHQMEQQREQAEQTTPEVAAEPPVAVEPEVKVEVKPESEPVHTSSLHEPHPSISAEEGLKTCVWKIMSDHKPYTTADIVLLLGELGVPKLTVTTLMSHLNVAHSWFDVSNINKVRHLTLRADIARPENDVPYKPTTRVQTVGKSKMKADAGQEDLPLGEQTDKFPPVEGLDALVSVPPKQLSDAAITLDFRYSKSEHPAYIHSSHDKHKDLTEADLVNARSRREWERSVGYGRPSGLSEGPSMDLGAMSYDPTAAAEVAVSCLRGCTKSILYLGALCSVCHTPVERKQDAIGPRGALSDMSTSKPSEVVRQMLHLGLGSMMANSEPWLRSLRGSRNAPIRAYGESEMRIPMSYGGTLHVEEPVVAKEAAKMESEGSLVKFLIQVGEAQLTHDQAVKVAEALVAQGYGPTRKASLQVESDLIKFPVVIQGQTFNPEQAQEIACTLVKAGFAG